jgi:hypothetical protein
MSVGHQQPVEIIICPQTVNERAAAVEAPN